MKKVVLSAFLGAVLGIVIATAASGLSGLIVFDERDLINGYRDNRAGFGLSGALSLAAYLGAAITVAWTAIRSKRLKMTAVFAMSLLGSIGIAEVGMEWTMTLGIPQTLLSFYAICLGLTFAAVWTTLRLPSILKSLKTALSHYRRPHTVVHA